MNIYTHTTFYKYQAMFAGIVCFSHSSKTLISSHMSPLGVRLIKSFKSLLNSWAYLFTIADVATAHPDKKSIIMYVTSLFQVLPHGVSMEAIQEVETLPRTTVTKEEHFLYQTQQRYSQQVRGTHTHRHAWTHYLWHHIRLIWKPETYLVSKRFSACRMDLYLVNTLFQLTLNYVL